MPGLKRQQGHLCRSDPRRWKRSRSGSPGRRREDQLRGEKDAFSRDDFAKRTSFLVTRTVASQGGIHGGQGADKENKARTELSQELWRNSCCAGAGDASANGAKWKEELRHGP